MLLYDEKKMKIENERSKIAVKKKRRIISHIKINTLHIQHL